MNQQQAFPHVSKHIQTHPFSHLNNSNFCPSHAGAFFYHHRSREASPAAEQAAGVQLRAEAEELQRLAEVRG